MPWAWKRNIILISFTDINNETFELNQKKEKEKRGYYDYHIKYKIVRPFKFKYLKEYSFEKGMPMIYKSFCLGNVTSEIDKFI